MHDLLISGGTIVDGSGRPGETADVAIAEGRIAGVGRDLGAARRTVPAHGLLVTPGWVDIHSHYDGQALWDPLLETSSAHGVTTVVMGNCGVGFAPVRPSERAFTIALMEGVEDIPGGGAREGPRLALAIVSRIPRRARGRRPTRSTSSPRSPMRRCASS
jgi:N-acyl-D-amino-acid deacylase